MKIELINITNKIFLLVFENQLDITSSFLRFQEHYESPEFRNKIFTLAEFKKWYSSLKGSFSYYSDWNGFNIPSYVLKPFYDGKFDPLSVKEKRILDFFKGIKGNFYVIGVHKDMKISLVHEVAHGLFYTDSEYHDSVVAILSDYDLTSIKSELKSKGGYHDEVLDDEAHAYSIVSAKKLKSEVSSSLHNRLKENFDAALVRNNIVLPKL